MKRSWRRAGAVAAVLFTAVLLFLAFRADPVRVELGRVERGPLVVTIDEEGETRVCDRFAIVAPIAGRVARIQLDAGDEVRRDTVVARMNPLPIDPRSRAEAEARVEAAEAALAESEARVAQARASAEQARRNAARARELAKAGTISRQEREVAETEEVARGKELEAAEASARAAAYGLEAARAALIAAETDGSNAIFAACEAGVPGCIELRSPIDGRVLRVPEESERVVTAGTLLLDLGDPARLEIVVDLLSTDAVKVPPGARVLVEEWGGGEDLRARVRTVEPSGFTKISALGVEEQRVNVIADFEGGTARLADGYRVEARIVVWQSEDVLKAPASAFFRRAGEWSVFVAEDGRARRRAVAVGERSANEVQILNGLAEGTQIILHPSDQVDDGVRIEPL